MIDFWLAVVLTIIISVFTIIVDFLASLIILLTSTLRSIIQDLDAELSPLDTLSRITVAIQKWRILRFRIVPWGADLAAVALSLDLTALVIWYHNHEMFPFFSRFNEDPVSREILVWLVLFGLHAIMLLLSLIFKHYHEAVATQITLTARVGSRLASWVVRNVWMIAADITGTIALLLSIVACTNAW